MSNILEFITPQEVIAIVVLMVIVVGFIIYKGIKDLKVYNNPFSVEDFVSQYGDKIVNVIKDAAEIVNQNEKTYESNDAYVSAVIDTTVDKIVENYKELGVDEKYIRYFECEFLVTAVKSIITGDKTLQDLVLNYLKK